MFLQEPLDPLPIHGDEAGQRFWEIPVIISLST